MCRWLGKKPVEDRGLLRLGQFFSAIFGLVIVSIASYLAGTEGRGIFEHMLNVGALLALPMAVPTLMGLFVKRSPNWAAIFTVCITLIPSALAFFSSEPWSFQEKVFTNSTVGTVAYLMTVPFWKFESPAYAAQARSFFERMKTPVDFEQEIGVPNDLSQLKIIGSFAAVIGFMICLLVFLPNPAIGRLGILFVGGFVLIVGGSFVLAGRQGSDVGLVGEKSADCKKG